MYKTVDALRDLQILVKFIDDVKEQMSETVRQIEKNSLSVRFQDLWYIFKVGENVFVKGTPQKVWRVLHLTGGRPFLMTNWGENDDKKVRDAEKTGSLILECYHLDFDGQDLGLVQRRFCIKPFDELKNVTSLEVYPTKYSSDPKGTEKQLKELTEQGLNFMECTRFQHRYCSGRTVIKAPSGLGPDYHNFPEEIDGQIIVDFDQTTQNHWGWAPTLGKVLAAVYDTREVLETSVEEENSQRITRWCRAVGCCQNERIVNDYLWDRLLMEEFRKERSDTFQRSGAC